MRSFTQPHTCLTTTTNSVKATSAVWIGVSSSMVHKYIHLKISSLKLKLLCWTCLLFITSSCELKHSTGLFGLPLIICVLEVSVRILKLWRNREDIDSSIEAVIWVLNWVWQTNAKRCFTLAKCHGEISRLPCVKHMQNSNILFLTLSLLSRW